MSEFERTPPPAKTGSLATVIPVSEIKVTGNQPKEGTTERDVTGIRVNAFLRQEYPLTEEGSKLRTLVEQAAKRGDRQELEAVVSQLPTVEDPRLHLFKDLELTPEQEAQIFGHDLADIQVTKGCSHKCDFCAAGSEASIQKMPFAAVLKMAEKKREYDKKMDEAWEDWENTRNGIIGLSQEELFTKYDEWRNNKIKQNRDNTHITDFISEQFPGALQEIDLALEHHPIRSVAGGNRLNGLYYDFFDKDRLLERPHITNYYDSDPLDYQDAAFPHEDGTPADYGDVFQALASETRPVHITTAGWPKGRKIAQRAAEKIARLVEKNPKLLSVPRLSVNKYEYRAKADLESYRLDMENAIATLFMKNQDQVLFFCNKDDPDDSDFIQEVIDPLKAYMKDIGSNAWRLDAPVSLYSGPMEDQSVADDHHDVMACMPGIHIWPDGTIAMQEYKWKYGEKKLDKGIRPTPTGKMAFEKRSQKTD